MRRGAILAAAGAVAVVGAAGAQDPLPLTGELQVNTFTTGAQTSPSVGMGADGTHVVVWKSQGQDGDGSEAVRFRKFPGDGTSPAGEGALHQDTAQDQFRVNISVNSGNDWTAVWESEVTGTGIRARRSTNGGNSLGAELNASVSTSTGTQFPEVDRGDDGSFAVVWESGGDSFLRLFDAAGDAVTNDVPAVTSFTESRQPSVAALPGGWVVAFDSPDGDADGVWAQLFDGLGLEVGDPVAVSSTLNGDQGFSDVAELAGGGFVVVWDDVALGARMRRFDSDGAPVSDEQSVGIEQPAANVRVDSNAAGGFVVTLTSGEVRAREFDRLGRAVSDLFQVNVTENGFRGSSDVGVGADRFVVAWAADGVDGSGNAVVRRIFRLRSVFADDFESGDTSGWSALQEGVAPTATFPADF